MPYMCVVAIGQDSCLGSCEWDQVSWPIYGSADVLPMQLRE